MARRPTDQLHQRFVERLRATAKARRMQLTHVPDHAGVSRSHFWDVLAGRKSPTLGWLADVAGALRCDPSELLSTGRLAPPPPRFSRATRQVPLMSMRAAARSAGLPTSGEVEPARWVVATTRRVLRPGMFASVLDGSICLFRLLDGLEPDGRVVMVQLRGLRDPESGGRYLVRRFRVAARRNGRVSRVVLEPANRKQEPLVLEGEPMGRMAPFAELLEVLVPASR